MSRQLAGLNAAQVPKSQETLFASYFDQVTPDMSAGLLQGCDFTQMFAATGIKRLPQDLKIATFFDISILPGKGIWKHMTAGSINEKQRLAESTISVLVDVDNVLGRENEQE